MATIHTYEDSVPYAVSSVRKPQNNLCTKYFSLRNRFCGNYVCRKTSYCENKDRRCWRHILHHNRPVVVLLMITSEGKIYNKNIWIDFIQQCEKEEIPIHLVIYDEHMYRTTVRHPWNLISRYRPSPLNFKNPLISLKNKHASLDYANVLMHMLEYGSRVENSRSCIVLTERTVPIRSAKTIYKKVMSFGSNCFVDMAYGVQFTDDPPHTIPKRRGGSLLDVVNNKAQALYSTKFLKEAIIILKHYAHIFGIEYSKSQGYFRVSDEELLNKWCEYTGAKPDEFWLFNSYLIHLHFKRNVSHPVRTFTKRHMKIKVPSRDHSVVSDVPVWVNNVKRSVVFNNLDKVVHVPVMDSAVSQYYKELRHTGDLKVMMRVTLRDVVKFLRKYKRNALFFRSVELDQDKKA